jgi:hypothetical protein
MRLETSTAEMAVFFASALPSARAGFTMQLHQCENKAMRITIGMGPTTSMVRHAGMFPFGTRRIK